MRRGGWAGGGSLRPSTEAARKRHFDHHHRVVARGGGDHEAVPDRLLVREPLPQVKQHADAVEHATSHQQNDAGNRQRRRQRFERHDNGPAEEQVEHHGQAGEAVHPNQLQDDARARHRPDIQKQPAAPAALHLHRDKGGIGAGDHHEDGGMVDPAEQILVLRRAAAVVERRGDQHRQQPAAIDDQAQGQRRIPSRRRDGHQRDDPGDAGDHAESMDPSVGNALASAERPRRQAAIV